jgi:hypothetical protein
MTTDEETIREFLNSYPLSGGKASAALDRIMARSIPELPDGWLYGYTCGPTPELSDHKWRVGIRQLHNERCLAGQGLTFRAACEAAIARIAEEVA